MAEEVEGFLLIVLDRTEELLTQRSDIVDAYISKGWTHLELLDSCVKFLNQLCSAIDEESDGMNRVKAIN